jgi:hypothetical protein
MPVLHHLASLSTGISEAQTIDYIIKPPLHQHHQILRSDARLPLGMREKTPELPLHNPVTLASFLLLP